MKKYLLSLYALSLTLVATAQTHKAVIETNFGKIVVELYDNTPQHRDNFIKLANQHFFDSTLFHRVIPQFVIQGGDPDSKHAAPGQMLGNGDLGYKVPAEINDSDFHKRGALGMARDNNPDKASNASQFYIVVGKKWTAEELDKVSARTGHKFTDQQKQVYETQGGVPFLDGNYTIFGEVLQGMDVVDKIANVARDEHDRPKEDVRMISVRMLPEHGNHNKENKHKKHKKKHKKFLGIF